MKIPRPLFDNLIIEIETLEDVTKSGVALPNASEQKVERGKVLAVGEEVEIIKKGDVVLFKSYSPVEVRIASEVYNFIKAIEVLAVL